MRALFLATYAANILLSFHYFLPAYVNSSYLSVFGERLGASVLFALAAVASAVLLLLSGRMLRLFGNRKIFVSFALLDMLGLTLLVLDGSPLAVFFGFILHQAFSTMMAYSLDIFLEQVSKESNTGAIRGSFLTSANLTLVCAPLLAALLIEAYGIRSVYSAALFLIAPVLFLGLSTFRLFKDRVYPQHKLRNSLVRVLHNKNLRAVFSVNFLLQFFYAWMVIYLPLTLLEAGFSWGEIGVLLSIMLLPFLLLEYPVGRMADGRLGEKELMLGGMLCLGIFTFVFGFSTSQSILWLTALLFMTRVGASLVEATTESYFFKQVTEADASLVALFRGGRVLSYIVGPLCGALVLQFFSLQSLFLVLGVLMGLGTLLVLPLRDTH